MRQIKFRAWDKKRNIIINNFHIDVKNNNLSFPQYDGNFGSYSGDKDYVLMQSTGLLDKNGKEIYEGDLLKSEGGDLYQVKYTDDDVASCGCHFPVFRGIGFVAELGEKRLYESWEETEIIGNIFENKDLLIKATINTGIEKILEKEEEPYNWGNKK